MGVQVVVEPACVVALAEADWAELLPAEADARQSAVSTHTPNKAWQR